MTRLSIHADALAEIDQAAAFYDLKAHGLGLRFLRAIEAGFDIIERHPERFQIFHGDRRRILIADFPYRIIYRLKSTEIRILAIAHTRRSPGYWQGRK